MNDPQWHHPAHSYDGTNWAGYLDGAGVFSVKRAFSLNTAPKDWFIGGAAPGVAHAAGTFDEVRIGNIGRSKDEIQANTNRRLSESESGLAACFKLDEGAGATTADTSGHGFSGTLENGPQWVASDAPMVPDVRTLSQTGVSVEFATFHGTVNPLGRPASARFEWGLSTNYGRTTAVTNGGGGAVIAQSRTASIESLFWSLR